MARRKFSNPKWIICRQLLRQGLCDEEGCPFVHDAFSCEVCQTVMSYSSRPQHLNGKKHKSKVAEKANGSTIGIPALNSESLTDRQAAFCATCEKHIPVSARANHPSNLAHLRKERYLLYKVAEERLETNKAGVEVGRVGGIDFGTIDIDQPSRNVLELQLDVAVADGGRIEWNPCHLTPSAQTAGFKVSKFPTATNSRDHRLTVSFEVNKHPGIYSGRLELSFRRPTISQKSFTISRALTCRVGSVSDFEQLAAIAPFKRIRRKDVDLRIAEEVVPGEKPQAIASIRWLRSLENFVVPKYVINTVEDGFSIQIDRMMSSVGTLSAKTLEKYWKMVLWLEETQMMRDIRNYDLSGVTMTSRANKYILSVPGLAEKRPSVLIGDAIHVREKGMSGKWNEGFVHSVELSNVVLRFDNKFKPIKNTKFDVRFTISRLPMRRMHQAMNVAAKSPIAAHLFPKSLPHIIQPVARRTVDDFEPFDRKLSENVAQKTAVISIIENTHTQFPIKIVFGPFGTGKTSTLIEAARQLLARTSAKLLLCAPSNAAADILAERLALHLNHREILRMNAPSRVDIGVPEAVRKISRKNQEGFFCVPPLEELLTFRVVVCTLLSAPVLYGVGVEPGHFSHVMIDEAGQAMEPECLIPIIEMYKPGRVQMVLAGDPQQLGPITRSKYAQKFGLNTSLLERLMQLEAFNYKEFTGRTVVKLVQNYRNHPAILKFPNERFYESELQAHADPTLTHSLLRYSELPDSDGKFPIIFHEVKGKDEREASSPSFFNILEVTVVKKYVISLLEDKKLRLDPEQIGVISPYHGQVQKLRKAFSGRNDMKKIKVGSTEEFQGQERRVIIISTVRSNEEYLKDDEKLAIGFLSNPKRFNVAITRTQALLIIVGDPNVLSVDPLWRDFLWYIYSEGGWVGPRPTWDGSKGENGTSYKIGEMDRMLRIVEDEEIEEQDVAQRPWVREE